MSRTCNCRLGRDGFTTLELTVSMVLLLAAMVVVAQCVGHVSGHWRQTRRHRQALQLCNNALERASLLPWPDLDRAGELVAPEVAVDRLPEGALQLQAERQADGACRIVSRVTWTEDSGSGNEVTLTTWRYPIGAEAEKSP